MNRKREIVRSLMILLVLLELGSVVEMRMNADYLGMTAHGFLAVLFTILGSYSFKLVQKTEHHSKRTLEESTIYSLLIISLLMLNMIAIHDFDHMRQAMAWDYQFTLSVLLVNLIVYVPNWIAIILISKGKLSGILASIVSGPLIASSFLKVHILGAWIPVWGLWNDSFFVLGADQLSWVILTVTALVGVGVGMASCYYYGKEKQRNVAI